MTLLSPHAVTPLNVVPPPFDTSASGRHNLAPRAKPPPTPSVPKAPVGKMTTGVTRQPPQVTSRVTPWGHPMVSPNDVTQWGHPVTSPNGVTQQCHPTVSPNAVTLSCHPMLSPNDVNQ